MTSEQQPSDRDRQESTPEGSGSSAGGRIRESIGTARQAIGRGFDQVTGTEFRRQFDEFTSVISSAVLGVHQDQAELRERIERLEERSAHAATTGRLTMVVLALSLVALIAAIVAVILAS